MCKKHTGLQRIQHLYVYPFRYQLCLPLSWSPILWETCLPKKELGRNQMEENVSCNLHLQSHSSAIKKKILCYRMKYIYLTFGLTFMQTTSSEWSGGLKKFRWKEKSVGRNIHPLYIGWMARWQITLYHFLVVLHLQIKNSSWPILRFALSDQLS